VTEAKFPNIVKLWWY